MIRITIRLLLIAGSITTLLTSGVCQVPAAKPRAKVAPESPTYTLARLSDSLQQLAGQVSAGVVQIEVSGFRPAEDKGRKDSSAVAMVRERTVGSGMIVDPDGYIMTNAHVVTGAQQIRVVLPASPGTLFDVTAVSDAQVLDAKIIGSQPDLDLALLKVEAHGLHALHFNLERDPQPGELVVAIGSPEGLQNSVSMGVVSSAWRQPNPDNPMVYLQTDAPINPGNSGGPLVDVEGAVVGMNTFILTNSGGNEGLGFAIPAHIVDFVYQSLKKYGHLHHIEIGVSAQTVTPTMARGLGLARNWGVVISDVVTGGPASQAGLEPGDIVLDVDGQRVLGLPGFVAALYLHPSDHRLQITALRATQKLSFSVLPVLAQDPIDQLADAAAITETRISQLGILAVAIDDGMRSLMPEARLSTGVLVVVQEQGSHSAEIGLQPGDVIHALNRTPVSTIDQLQSAVASLHAGDAVVLQIERKGQLQYLAFEME